jgi:hypothetical protein
VDKHEDGLVNLAASTADQLAEVVRSRVKRIQYRHPPINGFLAVTGLTPAPP